MGTPDYSFKITSLYQSFKYLNKETTNKKLLRGTPINVFQFRVHANKRWGTADLVDKFVTQVCKGFHI